MGGGGGGVIVRGNARATLSDPVVHGQLPAWMQSLVDAIFAKDDSDWTEGDCAHVGHAYSWALCNCN